MWQAGANDNTALPYGYDGNLEQFRKDDPNYIPMTPEATELVNEGAATEGKAEESAKTTDLYRAVGVKEYNSIIKNKAFLPGGASLEGRQFAFTEDEALAYADKDLSKVAIFKVTVNSSVLPSLDIQYTIDTPIFPNGVVTVQPSQSEIFRQNTLRMFQVH
jgi:hypothetical protein